MIWVGWRQQRTEMLIAAGMLVLLAAVLVPTGLHMSSAYDRAGLAACVGADPSPACRQAADAFLSQFHSLSSLIGWLTLVPGLVGVLLSAPFALQFEHGTNRLDWTQSITRGRWIGGKLALACAATLLAAFAFTALVTWWRAPFVQIDGRMDSTAFDSEGIVVLGYALFALALGLAVGTIWRRAAAGLVVAFVGYFAARVLVDTWLRQRFLAPHELTWSAASGRPRGLLHAWVLTDYPSDRFGHRVSLPCPAVHGAGARLEIAKCLTHPVGFVHTVYQPASAFWTLQAIETALFGGAALVLLALTAWWAHERAT